MKIFSLIVFFGLLGGSLRAADVEKGKSLFKTLCSSCHGDMGKGDGPVGKSLPPGTVADLSKVVFKFAKDEAKFKELLKKGGGAVGLNALMPPAVVKDEDIVHLYAFVMSLRK